MDEKLSDDIDDGECEIIQYSNKDYESFCNQNIVFSQGIRSSRVPKQKCKVPPKKFQKIDSSSVSCTNSKADGLSDDESRMIQKVIE